MPLDVFQLYFKFLLVYFLTVQQYLDGLIILKSPGNEDDPMK